MDLLIYGLIFMVPIAPWAIFGTVYNESGGMVPLVYLIGLVAMIFTAIPYAKMAKSIPLAGSEISYVGRGINPTVGFFAGWAILLDYLLVPTLLYVFAAESMIGIFPDTPRWVWALAFVGINTVVNSLGGSSLKLMNRVFLAVELIFILIFVVIAVTTLSNGSIPGAEFTAAPLWDSSKVSGPLLASALSIAVFIFFPPEPQPQRHHSHSQHHSHPDNQPASQPASQRTGQPASEAVSSRLIRSIYVN